MLKMNSSISSSSFSVRARGIGMTKTVSKGRVLEEFISFPGFMVLESDIFNYTIR